MVSVEFENAYAAHKRTLGSLNIGAGLAKKEFAEAGVPEDYVAEALRRNIMPATIVKLCDEDIALDFVDAFLEGQEAYGMPTTADAAVIHIISLRKLLRNQEVPDDYSHTLLRMGAGYALICDCWQNNIALEYAQQMVAERIAERNA